jgi:hypothetical protein
MTYIKSELSKIKTLFSAMSTADLFAFIWIHMFAGYGMIHCMNLLMGW